AGNGPIAVGLLNRGNTGNGSGLLGLAALSGNNAGNGPIAVGLLNRDNTGNGRWLALAALSGHNAGTATEGLGIGLLNRGELVAIYYGGEAVLTPAGVRQLLLAQAAQLRGLEF